MYTLTQLAALAGVKPDTLYRYITRHNIPHSKVNGRIITSVKAIAGYTPRGHENWLLKASLI